MKIEIEIKPIKTEEQYNQALSVISSLLDAPSNSKDAERLELFSILVEVYEKEHYKIEAPDPISAIEFHMEQQALTRKDLEPYIGSRARVSEILSHKRPLSLEMIRRLNRGLGIPAEILINGVRQPDFKSNNI